METKIHELIAKTRELKGWTKRKLGEASGLSESTVGRIESGNSQNPESIKALIDALEIPQSVLETLQSKPLNHDMPQPEDTVDVPFWGEVPCGPPTDVQQEGYLGKYRILRHLAGKGRYILRAVGDSMEKQIRSNDLILVWFRDDITLREANGKVCTIILNRESSTKRVVVEFHQDGITPKTITLVPESYDPTFKPIIVDLTKDEFKVTGLVLRVIDHIIM